MMRLEWKLGYRLVPYYLLDGKSKPTALANNKGESTIFGCVLDHAQRATQNEVDNFFDRLSPTSPLIEVYIAKQRSKLHIIFQTYHMREIWSTISQRGVNILRKAANNSSEASTVNSYCKTTVPLHRS
jgi:hypothetical protein